MNITAIIPARYGSSRLPAKPLIDICGKPMIQRVYEQAKKTKLINKIIVATDHADIVRAVEGFGGQAAMTPSELKSGTDRAAFVSQTLSDTDIVVNLQGDEPLIPPEMIDSGIFPLTENAEINAGTIVKKIDSYQDLVNPNVVKAVLDNSGYAIYFSRSPIPNMRSNPDIGTWHLGHTYYKHIGLYVFRKDFLLRFRKWGESGLEKAENLEQLRILEHGFKIKATISRHDSIAVDTPEDAERIRNIIKQAGEKAI